MIILTILKIIIILLLLIAGLFLITMIFPVLIYISYIDGEKYYEVKYAFLSLFSSDGKKGIFRKIKKPGKKKNGELKHESESVFRPKSENDSEIKTESEAEPQSETVPHDKEKVSEKKKNIKKSPQKSRKPGKSGNPKKQKKSRLDRISDMWEKVMQIWEAASSPAKRLCKGIHFDKIYIDFRISDPDACDCALKYGKICVLVYNMLGVFNQMFSITKKSIDVDCIFNKEKSVYDISFTVRFHPIVCLVCGISFLWTYYFKIYKKKSGGKKGNGKQGTEKRKTDK